jgi:Putative Ig domain
MGELVIYSRLAVRAAIVCGCALVFGCGGGDSKVGTASNELAPQVQPASGANFVIVTGSAPTRGEGSFTSLEGAQLARSQSPVISSGRAEERYSFEAGPLQGYYRLYAWWPQSPQAAAGVKASIIHARGQSQQLLDQRQGAGQWQLLGIYGFEAAQAAQIQLSANAGTRFIADAVRFEYVGASPPPLSIRAPALSVGQQERPYSARVEAESGTPPYNWLVSAGSLPPGLNIDTHGRIGGTPTQAGSYPLTLRVVDAQGQAATQALSLHIVEAAAPAVPANQKPAKPADGNANGTPPTLASLLSLVAAAPEGSWVKANLNFFADVHSPLELIPLFDSDAASPVAIMRAWSSFAWDPNRGDLWIYGGGHANYSGNDVYRWRGSTRKWERASLPSEIKQDDLGNFLAIDGYNAAPPSTHTYDNNLFLPVIDRFITFGGASFSSGAAL